MELRYRRARNNDFVTCAEFVRCRLEGADCLHKSLLPFWQRLDQKGALGLIVLEDCDLPSGQRLLALGASVFVKEEFLSQSGSAETWELAARLMAAEAQEGGVILDRKEIALANAAGNLHLFILHYAEDLSALAPDAVFAARDKINQMFFSQHRGYQIREVLFELHYPELSAVMGYGGWKLRRSSRNSSVFGLTRTEATALVGSYMSALFVWMPPRLGFTANQQEFLREALEGLTDEELARCLHWSPSTVKKYWSGVYETVADCLPSVLPSGELLPAQSRGQEKKRRLLTYLRAHPEELRPFAA